MSLTFPARYRCPHARRLGHLAIAALVGALGAAGPRCRTAHAREQLRVRADAEFVNLGFVRGQATVDITGGLRDDVGRGIAGAEVVIPLTEGGSGHAAPCRSGDVVSDSGSAVTAHTDAVGFFCVRVSSESAREGTAVRYSGDRFHAATTATLPRETGQRRLELGFQSGTLTASLDSPSLVVWVTTRVVDSARAGTPVRLVLFSEPPLEGAPETELAATDAPIGSAAKFDVETRALGAPGTGKLVVRFAGATDLAPASATAILERRALAHLSLAAAPDPSDPSDGAPLLVGVGSVVGAVTDGWVEALFDGQPVGLAPVVAGAARVVAVFAAPRGKPALVTLRYVPSKPGWAASEPLLVAIPIRPVSPWAGTPWLLGAAAIGYWVVRAWRRPARAQRTRKRPGEEPARGRAAVELVEPDASRSGWRGRVVDAHEGTPVEGARVSVVVPVFDGEGVAASQATAADGSFALPHVEAAKNDGARLVVTAPYHATLSSTAPPDGTLSVCLVSRRRALLNRLVAWAVRSGRPWARHDEPTPLELVEVARHRQHAEVAEWATSIAEAAYGPAPPDERREDAIVAREPPVPRPADER